jgi:hypothetical protein
MSIFYTLKMDLKRRSLGDGDVFWLYERNMNYYRNCKTNGNTMNLCRTSWNNECYCHEHTSVQPIEIGDTTLPCRMNVKTYIPIGEMCPICLEGIYSKKNAYLTGCGHAFHKSCIQFVLRIRDHLNLLCPYCRSNLGRPEIKGRYGNTISELDCLENFWMTMN